MCSRRNTNCVYNVESDHRRRAAHQRTVQDLAEARVELQQLRQLLGGIIATIRVGSHEATTNLIQLIRSRNDLAQVAAFVRNETRADIAVRQAFDDINFLIDSSRPLPSPGQVLGPSLMLEATNSSGSESTRTGFVTDADEESGTTAVAEIESGDGPGISSAYRRT